MSIIDHFLLQIAVEFLLIKSELGLHFLQSFKEVLHRHSKFVLVDNQVFLKLHDVSSSTNRM